MQLVQIDPIGLQTPQAGLHGGKDVAARGVAACHSFNHGSGEFCRQNKIFAALAQHLAKHGFRASHVAVDVGCIEKSDAQIKRLAHHFVRGFEVNAHAEVVAAKSDHGHFESGFPEGAVVHVLILEEWGAAGEVWAHRSSRCFNRASRTSSTRRRSDCHITRMSSKRLSICERKSSMREFMSPIREFMSPIREVTSPMRELKSPSRELLIRMPIHMVSIVGIDASTIGRIWLSFISYQSYQNSATSLPRKRSAG